MTVAFALSGGGNLGPMQAGTVVALMEAGIRPDLLVGTSVGALNAAFLASRPGRTGADELMAAWAGLRRRQAVRISVLGAFGGFLGFRSHLLSDQSLRQLIRAWIPIERIEDARIPLAVTATDALTGECVLFTSGPTEEALVASAAIPGLFPTVAIDGRWLVDGSLSANQPIRQAQQLGAEEIYVISTRTAARVRPPRGAIAVAMNSVSLVTSRMAREELAEATRVAEATSGRIWVVPTSEPEAPGPFDFRRSGQLARDAYRRTQQWLAQERPDGSATPVRSEHSS
jgi:NTE family protein